jgi:L-lactate dehydrogenase complex protein LldE
VDVLGRVDLGARLRTRACYHGSCQVDRALGITEAPRALLSAVRWLTLVEAARPDRCCGFGGVFSLQFSGVSQALVEDKAEEILATEADMLVSAEPSCLMNIGGHLARVGGAIPALHVAQVLALGLGKGDVSWK